jgi:hypothetical protein
MQKLIKKYLDQFETKQRGEDTIVVLRPTASEELKKSVYETHQGMLPHDWIFSTYNSILERMIEYDDFTTEDDSIQHEIVDSLVYVYTHDLTSWLNSSNYFTGYIDQAVQDLEAKDNILSIAQYIAIQEIYGFVISLLEETK